MKKMRLGIWLGMMAGIIYFIPMLFSSVIQWELILSVFFFWTVCGFFISVTHIGITGMFKGIIISLLILLPDAIVIAWRDPYSLIWVVVMNVILGAILGFLIERYDV